MNEKKKHILHIVIGLIGGYLSYWWLEICHFFISEAYNSRGTYEWEENKSFIPYAYTGIGIYCFAVLLFVYVMRRKKKKLFTALFSILVGAIETYFYYKFFA